MRAGVRTEVARSDRAWRRRRARTSPRAAFGLTSARGADPHAGVQDLEAVRTLLRWRESLARLLVTHFDRVDRTEALDVAGEVEHQGVGLARMQPEPAADHLDVEPGRLRRPEQRDR